jgi:hypothetical protein
MMTADSPLPPQRPARARFPRWMVLAMYSAYPLGLLLLEGPAGLAGHVAGLVLITLSFVLAWRLWQTPFWRAGNQPDCALDERERALRDRAYRRAYTIAGTAVLLGLVYVQLAFDSDDRIRYWLPAGFDEASRLFWGAFLVLITLPAAILAWDREALD